VALQVVRNDETGPQKVIAAVYARVSTFNGQDPTMQTRELTEYCQRRVGMFLTPMWTPGFRARRIRDPNSIGSWLMPMLGDSM